MNPRKSQAQIKIERVTEGRRTRAKDQVAVEEPLEIRLQFAVEGRLIEKPISITMRTPGNDFELAAGFLFTEGIIQSCDQILKMSYCVGPEKEKQEFNIVSIQLTDDVRFDAALLQRNFYTTSSCGVCGKASLEALQIRGCPVIPNSTPKFSTELIYQLPEKIRSAQAIFEKTGGLHAAALFDNSGDLDSLQEDVGRHNAVDKLIGQRMLDKKIPLTDYLLLVSGRASFEIMQKALMAGIPIVAAVGAPSSLAVDLAKEFGITLIGFLRGKTFNIYTEPERIKAESGSLKV